jgi:hypothetical protein
MNNLHRLIFIGLTFLGGCTASTGNWNDHIDSDSRTQIKAMNERVIEAIHKNNSQKLITLFSNELKAESGTEIPDFLNKIHSSFESENYTLLDEYMTTNSAVGTTATVLKGVSGESVYKINYPVITKETYISLIIIDGIINKVLLTCMYGKYGEEWKVNVLRVGDYSYFDKNAVDFYKQAKSNYENGHLIDAATDITMVQQTAVPAENFFQYQKEDEMKAFAKNVFKEANEKYPMPMKVEAIKTIPQIYNIMPKPMNEGVFPMVSYISKINLKDTVSLKAENEELKKVIGTLFPGIDKNKKYVFFQAYNDIPNGRTPTEHFGFALITTQQ